MKLLRIVVLMGFLTIPVIAKIHTPYLFVSSGAAFPQRETVIPGLNNNFTVRTDTDNGILLGGGIGYKFKENLKMEFEVNHCSLNIADLETVEIKVLGLSIEGGKGKLDSLSFTANGRYDFPIGGNWMPYLLGGVGTARVSLKDVYIQTAPVIPNPPVEEYLMVDDNNWQFAFQAGIGLTYLLEEHFILDIGYRYFVTSETQFHTVNGEEFKENLQRGHLLLSLRYLFN